MSSSVDSLFKDFFDFCSTVLVGENPKLVDLIQHRYDECDESFRNSQNIADLLIETKAKMKNEESRLFVHLKEFTDVLKANRKSKKKSGGKKRKRQPEPEAGPDMKPKECRIVLERANDCLVHPSSPGSDCGGSESKRWKSQSCVLGDGDIAMAEIIRDCTEEEQVSLRMDLEGAEYANNGLNSEEDSSPSAYGDLTDCVKSSDVLCSNPKRIIISRPVPIVTFMDSDSIIRALDTSCKVSTGNKSPRLFWKDMKDDDDAEKYYSEEESRSGSLVKTHDQKNSNMNEIMARESSSEEKSNSEDFETVEVSSVGESEINSLSEKEEEEMSQGQMSNNSNLSDSETEFNSMLHSASPSNRLPSNKVIINAGHAVDADDPVCDDECADDSELANANGKVTAGSHIHNAMKEPGLSKDDDGVSVETSETNSILCNNGIPFSEGPIMIPSDCELSPGVKDPDDGSETEGKELNAHVNRRESSLNDVTDSRLNVGDDKKSCSESKDLPDLNESVAGEDENTRDKKCDIGTKVCEEYSTTNPTTKKLSVNRIDEESKSNGPGEDHLDKPSTLSINDSESIVKASPDTSVKKSSLDVVGSAIITNGELDSPDSESRQSMSNSKDRESYDSHKKSKAPESDKKDVMLSYSNTRTDNNKSSPGEKHALVKATVKNMGCEEKPARRVPLVSLMDIGDAKMSFLGSLSLSTSKPKNSGPQAQKIEGSSPSFRGRETTSFSKAMKREEKQASTSKTTNDADPNSADEFAPDRTSTFKRLADDAKAKGKKPPSERHIQKLEKLLEKLRDEIERGREMSLDDLDQEDSFYIYEDKLKKKFVAAWTKLCEITSRTVTTGRPTERTIHYDGTRYREINRRLEKFLNKNKVFPDFQDVKTMIKLTNKKYNLHLSVEMINDTAREAFVDIGEMLQTRRHQDFIATFGSHETDVYSTHADPAFNDLELRRKLDSNRKLGRQNLDAVISKYTQLQYTRGAANDDDDDGDDDDDEEGGASSKKKKEKEPEEDASPSGIEMDVDQDDEEREGRNVRGEDTKTASSECQDSDGVLTDRRIGPKLKFTTRKHFLRPAYNEEEKSVDSPGEEDSTTPVRIQNVTLCNPESEDETSDEEEKEDDDDNGGNGKEDDDDDLDVLIVGSDNSDDESSSSSRCQSPISVISLGSDSEDDDSTGKPWAFDTEKDEKPDLDDLKSKPDQPQSSPLGNACSDGNVEKIPATSKNELFPFQSLTMETGVVSVLKDKSQKSDQPSTPTKKRVDSVEDVIVILDTPEKISRDEGISNGKLDRLRAGSGKELETGERVNEKEREGRQVGDKSKREERSEKKTGDPDKSIKSSQDRGHYGSGGGDAICVIMEVRSDRVNQDQWKKDEYWSVSEDENTGEDGVSDTKGRKDVDSCEVNGKRGGKNGDGDKCESAETESEKCEKGQVVGNSTDGACVVAETKSDKEESDVDKRDENLSQDDVIVLSGCEGVSSDAMVEGKGRVEGCDQLEDNVCSTKDDGLADGVSGAIEKDDVVVVNGKEKAMDESEQAEEAGDSGCSDEQPPAVKLKTGFASDQSDGSRSEAEDVMIVEKEISEDEGGVQRGGKVSGKNEMKGGVVKISGLNGDKDGDGDIEEEGRVSGDECGGEEGDDNSDVGHCEGKEQEEEVETDVSVGESSGLVKEMVDKGEREESGEEVEGGLDREVQPPDAMEDNKGGFVWDDDVENEDAEGVEDKEEVSRGNEEEDEMEGVEEETGETGFDGEEDGGESKKGRKKDGDKRKDDKMVDDDDVCVVEGSDVSESVLGLDESKKSSSTTSVLKEKGEEDDVIVSKTKSDKDRGDAGGKNECDKRDEAASGGEPGKDGKLGGESLNNGNDKLEENSEEWKVGESEEFEVYVDRGEEEDEEDVFNSIAKLCNSIIQDDDPEVKSKNSKESEGKKGDSDDGEVTALSECESISDDKVDDDSKEKKGATTTTPEKDVENVDESEKEKGSEKDNGLKAKDETSGEGTDMEKEDSEEIMQVLKCTRSKEDDRKLVDELMKSAKAVTKTPRSKRKSEEFEGSKTVEVGADKNEENDDLEITNVEFVPPVAKKTKMVHPVSQPFPNVHNLNGIHPKGSIVVLGRPRLSHPHGHSSLVSSKSTIRFGGRGGATAPMHSGGNHNQIRGRMGPSKTAKSGGINWDLIRASLPPMPPSAKGHNATTPKPIPPSRDQKPFVLNPSAHPTNRAAPQTYGRYVAPSSSPSSSQWSNRGRRPNHPHPSHPISKTVTTTYSGHDAKSFPSYQCQSRQSTANRRNSSVKHSPIRSLGPRVPIPHIPSQLPMKMATSAVPPRTHNPSPRFPHSSPSPRHSSQNPRFKIISPLRQTSAPNQLRKRVKDTNAYVAAQQKKIDGLVMVLDDSDEDESKNAPKQDKTLAESGSSSTPPKPQSTGNTQRQLLSSPKKSSSVGNGQRPSVPSPNMNLSSSNSPKSSPSAGQSPRPSPSAGQSPRPSVPSSQKSPTTSSPAATKKTGKKSGGVIVLSDSE